MKKWFAFVVGPQGGISSSAMSPPLGSRSDAEGWAKQHFAVNLGKVQQIAIAEVVALCERDVPPPPPMRIIDLQAEGNIAEAA